MAGLSEVVECMNQFDIKDDLISLSQRFEQAVGNGNHYGQLLYIIEEKNRWQKQREKLRIEESDTTSEDNKEKVKATRKKILFGQIGFVIIMIAIVSLMKDYLGLYEIIGVVLLFIVGEIVLFAMYKRAGKDPESVDVFQLDTSISKRVSERLDTRDLEGRIYKESGEYYLTFERVNE